MGDWLTDHADGRLCLLLWREMLLLLQFLLLPLRLPTLPITRHPFGLDVEDGWVRIKDTQEQEQDLRDGEMGYWNLVLRSAPMVIISLSMYHSTSFKNLTRSNALEQGPEWSFPDCIG